MKKKMMKPRSKALIRLISLIIIVVMLFQLLTIGVNANTFYTIRIYFCYSDGTPAHDPYVATFTARSQVDLTVTYPNVNGFTAMELTDPANDPRELPTGGREVTSKKFTFDSLEEDVTHTIYYIPGLTHYAARYYLQNIYDDLYTLNRDRTNANQNRVGKTGSTPDDLEAEVIPGFTSLFHEPDAIAADGSTVFRVYYDRNYYSINYDLGEGGYGVEPLYAKYQTVYRIEEPKRLGYTFLGWARTSGDSSNGVCGTDWVYIQPDTVVNVTQEVDDQGKKVQVTHYYRNASAFEDGIECTLEAVTIDEATATASQNLIHFSGDQTVPAYNSYYKAIWEAGTTHFNVVYWIENANSTLDEHSFDGKTDAEAQALISANYSALAVRDVYNVYDETSDSLVPVTPGMEIGPDTRIRTRQQRYDEYEGRKSADNFTQLQDFFSFNLNYADTSKTPEVDEEDGVVYMFDTDNNVIDFNSISKGESEELSGHGKYFRVNTEGNTPHALCETDRQKTVLGDGTTRFNVFLRRVPFTLKFFYAREKISDGTIDLTCKTKNFSQKKYVDTTDKNPLRAVSSGPWKGNIGATRPKIAEKYRGILTSSPSDEDGLHVDYDSYRYWYYQVESKYNAPLKGKWLIDAITPVGKKGYDGQTCYPASWATEYNMLYQNRNRKDLFQALGASDNFTIKGFYEKLGDEMMFIDDRANYTTLHFLLSWANTGTTNGESWNNGSQNILHFRYENYIELLPKELERMEEDLDEDGEPDGAQGLIDDGTYIDVITRTFTDLSGNSVTRTYGLPAENRIETIDSGSQYNNNGTKTGEVYKNQTAAEMTGFEFENSNKGATGRYELTAQNTQVDWSIDGVPDENRDNGTRRCTIKYFYRRRTYTLYYFNGSSIDDDHTRTVMYNAPMNSTYHITDGEHFAGQYRYYWPDPEYYIESLRGYYQFDGWYNDPRFEEPFDLDTQTMPADDEVLYAKWTPKKINVVFYNNYDNYYADRRGNDTFEQTGVRPDEYGSRPDLRIVLGKDDDDNDVTVLPVEYGSYTPLMKIPVDDSDPANPRPKLSPMAESASFAGWYYMRNRVPYRFEPENVPVTALNEDSTGDNATLRLFAEWVTKDVAKYRINYVRDDDPTVEVAHPTIGRAYVWKTKTFNAKSGSDLYPDYQWTAAGVDEGNNWWPTTNSHSLVIKANDDTGEYSPNEHTFRYIQKSKVWYKVQYLDAATRRPLVEGGDIEKQSSNASVKEDARIIPGYIVKNSSQSLVLTASTEADHSKQKEEELENNVITFLYERNEGEYLYEVEYLTQDLTGGTYSVSASETLTVPIAEEGDTTTVAISDLFSRPIPTNLLNNGYIRVNGGVKYTVTDAEGVTDPTLNAVADDGSVTITSTDTKSIKIYYDRKSYPYVYKYIDHTAEKLHANDPVANPWDGVIATFDDPSQTAPVGQQLTIDVARDYTYTDPSTSETSDYTRITNADGTLNNVTMTIQPDDDDSGLNIVKIYYRLDTERELNYQLVCVNDNPDTDYYEDGTPKFGALTFTMQTVLDYDSIGSVSFNDTNEATETVGGVEENLHLHKYTFLGWYTTPDYDPDNPSANRLTTSATLAKEDLGTNGELPEVGAKYYALVKQDMVRMDVMFYFIDETRDVFRSRTDEEVSAELRDAINHPNDPTASHTVYPDGSLGGFKVDFTSPNRYQNHTQIPWHRNDGYTLAMSPIDTLAYKYEFVEWWKDDPSLGLIRKENWNSALDYSGDSLYGQLARNTDQYLIAVYAKKAKTSMPYSIDYTFNTRTHGQMTMTVKGTLTEEQLTPENPECAITSDDIHYELTDEFILAHAPYESNHGERLVWSDNPDCLRKSSVGGDGSTTFDTVTASVTAIQSKQQVVALYRTTPTGDYANYVTGFIDDNYKLNEGMYAITASDTYDGRPFSHWEVRKSASDSSPVVAKSYSTLFDLCLFDNYYISPVYGGPGNKTATFDPNGYDNGNEDYYAWTWNEGESGELVRPTRGLTFCNLNDKVKFIRMPKGQTPDDEWSNVWNRTEDLDVTDNGTFVQSGWSDETITGGWSEEDRDTTTVTLSFLDYTRNRWTDESQRTEANEGVPADGSTDILYTDFEIAFEDGANRIHAADGYEAGVVFEQCEASFDGEFDPNTDYGYLSDPTRLKNAIKSAITKDHVTSGRYKYDPNDLTLKRPIQLSYIPTDELTNRDRVNYAKGFRNEYTVSGTGEYTYTNKDCLIKVTAFIYKDDTVTLSDPKYICLKDIASKNTVVDASFRCDPVVPTTAPTE